MAPNNAFLQDDQKIASNNLITMINNRSAFVVACELQRELRVENVEFVLAPAGALLHLKAFCFFFCVYQMQTMKFW